MSLLPAASISLDNTFNHSFYFCRQLQRGQYGGVWLFLRGGPARPRLLLSGLLQTQSGFRLFGPSSAIITAALTASAVATAGTSSAAATAAVTSSAAATAAVVSTAAVSTAALVSTTYGGPADPEYAGETCCARSDCLAETGINVVF